MFSVVCVYNKKDVLENVLLKSLSFQTVPYELIALDNSQNQYESVAAGLNAGGARATGKYIMFVHQDVDLLSPTWLRETEKILDRIPDLGAAGVAGARREGGRDFDSHLVGWILDWGGKITEPVKVQTFDELLLMTPREVFLKNHFDAKTFDFIHLFGADYCLRVAKEGYGVYVVPGYLAHKSGGSFVGVDKYRVRLFLKHRDQLPIFTSCGKISYSTIWKFVILSLLPAPFVLWMRKVSNAARSRLAK
jgi:GT2 family glycosyltransferase